MASRVVMPKLSDTMEEGVLLRWYKQEGVAVESGDAIAEIETDKAVMDLEAYASGILRKILAPEGAHVPAGGLIAVIGRQDEDIEPLLRGAGPTAESKKPTMTAQEIPARPEPRPSPEVPSEPGRKAPQIAPKQPEPAAKEGEMKLASGDQEVVLSSMRRAIARKMVQSKAPVPHFYVTGEVGMDRALDLKAQLQEAWGEDAPSISGLILKSCTIALQRVPAINASFGEDRIILHRAIHLGIAVALDEGLIVPVLRNCESKRLRQLASEANQLIARARTRRLRPEEYTGATFSVSNLGMFGVDDFIAVITPPEAAALAVGKVCEKPVVREGRVIPAHIMRVTLSCDHRVIDGVQAARFLEEFRKTMEQPFRLLAEDQPFPKDPKRAL